MQVRKQPQVQQRQERTQVMSSRQPVPFDQEAAGLPRLRFPGIEPGAAAAAAAPAPAPLPGRVIEPAPRGPHDPVNAATIRSWTAVRLQLPVVYDRLNGALEKLRAEPLMIDQGIELWKEKFNGSDVYGKKFAITILLLEVVEPMLLGASAEGKERLNRCYEQCLDIVDALGLTVEELRSLHKKQQRTERLCRAQDVIADAEISSLHVIADQLHQNIDETAVQAHASLMQWQEERAAQCEDLGREIAATSQQVMGLSVQISQNAAAAAIPPGG